MGHDDKPAKARGAPHTGFLKFWGTIACLALIFFVGYIVLGFISSIF